MREIKFRGKRTDTGEWVYGHYYVAIEGIRICHCIVENRDTKYYVNHDSIGEFTGFKDKKGKEIYEGDIHNHNGNKYVCVFSQNVGVVFIAINKNLGSVLDDRVVMMYHNHRSYLDIHGIQKYIEVIGNIYENPELLK